MWRKSAGEAGVMQFSKYLCFQKGLRQGLQAVTLGRRRRERSGFARTLCFHTTQPYSLQLKQHHCAMCTPGLNSQNCPIVRAHPALSSHLVPWAVASHFHQASVENHCLLFDRWTWKRKRQNIVVVQIWAKIQMLWGLSLPNQWTNKQTISLFFFLILAQRKHLIQFERNCSLSIFSKFNRNKRWE